MNGARPPASNVLQNSSSVFRSDVYPSQPPNGVIRNAPVLPPRPQGPGFGGYNSYMPYSNYSAGYGYSSYGGSLPYRSYGSYGGYGYGMGYNMGGYPYGTASDTERRFIQYAEERSRSTFTNIENIVQAVNSLAMMLDNTFFAITSSFRAVLSVAEHFGRLRSVFGHIWYTINIFRLFSWFYRKFLQLIGKKVPQANLAWKEATGRSLRENGASTGTNFSTLAFLGLIISTPYLVSKFLPKYEDHSNPETWKSPGIKARAAFPFVSTSPSELSLQTNEDVLLAPTYVQEEMKLVNSGWAFAVSKSGKSGLVPLNYLVLSGGGSRGSGDDAVPIPREQKQLKSSLKRVSFGENEVVTLEDVDRKLSEQAKLDKSRNNNNDDDVNDNEGS